MYQAGEIEIVMGKALARWAEANSYTSALPPAWLRDLSERVTGYCDRLTEAGKFEEAVFEEDVYKLVSALAVEFLPMRRSTR